VPHGGVDAAKSQKSEACEARVPIVTLVPQISRPLQCHMHITSHSLPFFLNLGQRGALAAPQAPKAFSCPVLISERASGWVPVGPEAGADRLVSANFAAPSRHPSGTQTGRFFCPECTAVRHDAQLRGGGDARFTGCGTRLQTCGTRFSLDRHPREDRSRSHPGPVLHASPMPLAASRPQSTARCGFVARRQCHLVPQRPADQSRSAE